MGWLIASLVVIVLAACAVVAWAAAQKGRSATNWFFLSLLVSPLLALLALLAAKSADDMDRERARSEGAAGAYRACTACAEPVLAKASRCPNCHASLTPVEPRKGWRSATISDAIGMRT